MTVNKQEGNVAGSRIQPAIAATVFVISFFTFIRINAP